MTDKQGEPQDKRVDSDWKERARRERECLGAQDELAGAGGEGAQAGDESGAERGYLPPPTFLALVVGIAAQASMGLGIAEDPATGKRETDLEAARHAIDMLDMLKAKTQGNLEDTEAGCLDELLYSLRMEYVRRTARQDKPEG
jgi:hypothetical protein